jgi:hypothetical protein
MDNKLKKGLGLSAGSALQHDDVKDIHIVLATALSLKIMAANCRYLNLHQNSK